MASLNNANCRFLGIDYWDPFIWVLRLQAVPCRILYGDYGYGGPRGMLMCVGLTIYYTVVKNVAGEAVKPWLGGEAQMDGIIGVGTYKQKPASPAEELDQATPYV
jgi:hypothetical protein